MPGFQYPAVDTSEPLEPNASTPKNPTALQKGNAALRAGQYAAAIRHYALGLLDQHNQPQPSQLSHHLAQNLLLARKRYRRQRQSSGQLQVAVACWSLSENPAGRAHTLASLYQDLAAHGEGGIHGVAIIGSLFARRGRELWAPIRDTDLPVHSILVEDDRQFMAQAINLVSSHPYDLIHLSKPRFPNILFGLLYKLLWDARVLVDIDDDELAFVHGEPLPTGAPPFQPPADKAADPAGPPASSPPPESTAAPALEHWLRRYNGLPPWQDLPGCPWTELGMSLCHAFDGLSVANRALQRRHGGTIIRHARDPRQFRPCAERRARARVQWQIAPAQRVVIFLGTPRRHKGLLETAQALASLSQPNLLLLIAGRFPDSEQALREALEAEQTRGRLTIRLLDDQPFADIPDLLAAADLAVLLQDPDSPAARNQTPAKLSDALAMGLTVLAEPTPGLADLLEQDAFIPVTRDTLAATLSATLATSPPEPQPRQPHPVFTRNLSLQANRQRLQTLLADEFRRTKHRTDTRLAGHTSGPDCLEHLSAIHLLGPLPRTLVKAQSNPART
ncbi:glycosyltransferase [Thiorhodococcus fuscus]|uniref:Glycosyltransferase n=1 Tax=Thiorhodococcus fuscus TaxID=527200 RepID=A0ABW4YEB1_9GAMM